MIRFSGGTTAEEPTAHHHPAHGPHLPSGCAHALAHSLTPRCVRAWYHDAGMALLQRKKCEGVTRGSLFYEIVSTRIKCPHHTFIRLISHTYYSIHGAPCAQRSSGSNESVHRAMHGGLWAETRGAGPPRRSKELTPPPKCSAVIQNSTQSTSEGTRGTARQWRHEAPRGALTPPTDSTALTPSFSQLGAQRGAPR